MDNQYKMLVNILDKIRSEAPKSYTSYHPSQGEEDELIKARSLAFIHLLLKVKFGLVDFLSRHEYITDGTQDGGLDAYYIDSDKKVLYLIQSKFRTSDNNFETKSMSADDLIKMEVNRITKAKVTDSNGVPYNSKIIAFQKRLSEIRDIAKYDYKVLFLGNVKKLNDEQIRKLIDNCEYEIIDSKTAYEDLIFPLATGTYYDPDEIIICLVLHDDVIPRLKQAIYTDFGDYSVTVLFAPVFEVGKAMAKYKNALLKYNPRNYLSLKKKSVNEKIRASIMEQEKNNFALLNNGITILCDNVYVNDQSGKKNQGQLIIEKPQILNGGQTAYTLSEVFEEYKNKEENPLKNKDVMLKMIAPISNNDETSPDFIQLISNATNQQNEVSEADRRSNHEIQIYLQKKLFSEYGYFYQRKDGEFFDGLKQGIIDRSLIIDRLDFIKAYKAYLGDPAAARRTSETVLFKEDVFYEILHDISKYHEMFFAYLLFDRMVTLEKELNPKSDQLLKYGYSLLYGKWAVIASIGIIKLPIENDPMKIINQARDLVAQRLELWGSFDKFVKEKRKDTKYFSEGRANYELYYKINLLDEDIREYFLR